MVAHLGLDVLILAMTCEVIVVSTARWMRRQTGVCLAGTGRRRLMARPPRPEYSGQGALW
jgi:hypothetical protein